MLLTYIVTLYHNIIYNEATRDVVIVNYLITTAYKSKLLLGIMIIILLL